MTAADIPEEVLRFIARNVDSVPHLEALLLLYEQPELEWTVPSMAARLYVSQATAAALLKDLEGRSLAVTVQGAAGPVYAYSAAWDSSGELMKSVAATYRKRLAPVVALIHSKASRPVREFARAFDLKKDP